MPARDPKLALVLPFGAAASHGGAAIFRSLFSAHDGSRLLWHDMMGRSSSRDGPGTASSTAPVLGVLQRTRLQPLRRILGAAGEKLEARLLAGSAAAAVRAFDPDLLLLYGHASLLLTYEDLLSRVGLPYHLSVHDCPIVHTRMPTGSAFATEEVRRRFAALYRGASSRDVISERMRRAYLTEFGADAIVVTKGVSLTDPPEAARRIEKGGPIRIEKGGPIRIVMGGAGFQTDLWPGEPDPLLAFADAVAADERFEFSVFDRAYAFRAERVRTVSWMPQRDYDRFLASMHIGYAYDMLTPIGREFARLSFPTKVVNYICQGLPVLYHGPSDSTVGDLLAAFPCGVVVESLDPAALVAGLERITERYDEMVRGCRAAASTLFDIDVIRGRFREAVQEGSLSAADGTGGEAQGSISE